MNRNYSSEPVSKTNRNYKESVGRQKMPGESWKTPEFESGGSGDNFYWMLLQNNCPKALHKYSASFWTSNFSISFWENPENHNLQDVRIWGRVHDSQNQCLTLETPRYFNKYKNIPNHLQTYYFRKSQNLGTPEF